MEGSTSGVSSTLVQRLGALAADYGQPVSISSGYRSTAEQQSIWDSTPEASRGITVARPGTSNHESGQAADISSDWFQGLSNEQLARYGLRKPMDYESWHVELA